MSDALLDGALTVREITKAGMTTKLWWDGFAVKWYPEPSEVPFTWTADASGLVAYKTADGWLLYESARLQPITLKWKDYYARWEHTVTISTSPTYNKLIQVQMDTRDTTYSPPSLDEREYMFLSGPFKEPPGL
jgi:hypothetical protein